MLYKNAECLAQEWVESPYSIGLYNPCRTKANTEGFILLSVVVAGKTAKVQYDKLIHFLSVGIVEFFRENNKLPKTPFEVIRRMLDSETLEVSLVVSKLGQYRRLKRTFTELVKNNYKLSVEGLESIYGIGPKTARMIIMYCTNKQNVAILDTHILKYLAAVGIKPVLKQTPRGLLYSKLEKEFLNLCVLLKITPQILDFAIWSAYESGDVTKQVYLIVAAKKVLNSV